MFSKKTTLPLFVLAFLVWAPVASAWSWPVKGPVLQTFAYDEANPYAAGQHRGIDIGAAAAGDPVVAPASGVVSFAGTVPTSGRCVTIETADGYSVTLTHLGTIAVSKGATVAEGSTVGTVGPSGTPDFAVPYVHLGIRVSSDANGYVDPLGLLPALAPPPPPGSGGSSSSGSAGAPAGSGDGSVSTPAPAPVPAPDPTPAGATATSASASGGSGLVIRERTGSSSTARRPVPETNAVPASPRRPQRVEQQPRQTASKPRRFEGIVEESAPTLPRHATATVPAELPPAPALGVAPFVLAAGPGFVAALAALATLLLRSGRKRPLAAVVVRFPGKRELRRAA